MVLPKTSNNSELICHMKIYKKLFIFRSGAKIRTKRGLTAKIHYPQYLDYEEVVEIAERFKKTDGDVVYVRHLTPNTTENRSIVALELHSDKRSKKPGILIIGGN